MTDAVVTAVKAEAAQVAAAVQVEVAAAAPAVVSKWVAVKAFIHKWVPSFSSFVAGAIAGKFIL